MKRQQGNYIYTVSPGSVRPMKKKEWDHILTIKNMPCGVCDTPAPSDAHHILQCGRRVSHYLTIPLCKDCHQDNEHGIHGRAVVWDIFKKSELSVLAETIEKLYGD